MDEITPATERLIRMEAKLDSHLYRTTQAEGRLDAHDGRLRSLETGHAKTIGLASGAAAVVSIVSGYFTSLIK